MAVINRNQLLWNILNEFEYISEQRFHTLAFVCEHKYYQQERERLTNAEYIELLSSIYSHDLKGTVQNTNRLKIEEVRAYGDKKQVIVSPITKVNPTPEKVRECILETVDEFGEESHLEDYAKSVIPNRITLTTPLNFSELHDSPKSLYERI